jgi:hypothetical protein
MTNTEAPAAPDLSSLTPRQRLNIAVAQTQGWEVWHYPPDSRAYLFEPARFVGVSIDEMVFMSGDGGKPVTLAPYLPIPLPDYASDPAAWGALMEKEGVWAEPLFNDALNVGGWQGRGVVRWDRGGWLVNATAECRTIGLAVCAAVLFQHNVDPTPYIGRVKDGVGGRG